MRLALVTNPFARKNRRDPDLRARLLAGLGPGALDLAPEGDDGWHEVARRLLDENIDAVGVSGGDGTMHCLLTALAKRSPDSDWPAIAVLRCGTMNTLAANLGVRGRPEVLAARMRDSHPVEVPCLKVGEHVGFLFGVGLAVSYLQAYYAGTPGPIGGAWLVARVVAGLPFQTRLVREIVRLQNFRVEVDGQPWQVESWRALGAGTVPSLGLGFQTCPNTPTPGRLEAYGFGGVGWSVVRNMHRMRLGLDLIGSNAPQALAQRVVIEADEDMPYMVDGDLFEGGRRLEVTDAGSVRFLV